LAPIKNNKKKEINASKIYSPLGTHAERLNNFAVLCKNLSEIQSSNPRDFDDRNDNFCDDTAKIDITRQMSKNMLDRTLPNL